MESEAHIMSTHNICFHGEIRQIFIWISASPLIPTLPMTWIKGGAAVLCPLGASSFVIMSRPSKCSPGVSFGTRMVNIPVTNKDRINDKTCHDFRISRKVFYCLALCSKYVNLPNIDIFLISPGNHLVWVLISASLIGCFILWHFVENTCM